MLEMIGVNASGGRTGLRDCNTRVRRGEVVGLAGLEGSGQGVFLRVAAGLKAPAAGRVNLASRSMAGKNHCRFLGEGVGYLPSGRLEDGLMPGLTVAEHVALNDQDRPFLRRRSSAGRKAREIIDAFRIAGTPESTVESLSGGNQQRLLLSLLPAAPKLLLLDNPTRGLDVESAMWMWHHLLSIHKRGASIVFTSSELDEILTVAHRILVFYEGRIIADVAADQTDGRLLGRAIAGKAG